MMNVSIKKISDFEIYSGEYKIPGIDFIYAGKGLGVKSWGMNIIRMQAGAGDYPDHDHVVDGQEEVYVILDGSASLITEDGENKLVQGMLVHVPPEIKRRFIPGEQGVTILALGGTPGKVYAPS